MVFRISGTGSNAPLFYGSLNDKSRLPSTAKSLTEPLETKRLQRAKALTKRNKKSPLRQLARKPKESASLVFKTLKAFALCDERYHLSPWIMALACSSALIAGGKGYAESINGQFTNPKGCWTSPDAQGIEHEIPSLRDSKTGMVFCPGESIKRSPDFYDPNAYKIARVTDRAPGNSNTWWFTNAVSGGMLLIREKTRYWLFRHEKKKNKA